MGGSLSYVDWAKPYLRRLRLHYLLVKNGFEIEGRGEKNYIGKKGCAKKFIIKPGDFLSEYRQALTYMRLYPYLEEKNNVPSKCGNIAINDGVAELDIDGIHIRFILSGDIYKDSPGFMFYFGEEDLAKMRWLGAELRGYTRKRSIRESDIVFDCGAYHGHFAIFAAKKAKRGMVYCFEPDPENREALERNVELNGIKNVVIIPKALTDKVGTVVFDAKGNGGAVIKDPKKDTEGQLIEIEATTISEYCKENNIREVDFIKMDVEGAEVRIIDGSRDFIEKNCHNLAIASYHKVGREETYKWLEPVFRKMGFETETAYPVHTTTYAWR